MVYMIKRKLNEGVLFLQFIKISRFFGGTGFSRYLRTLFFALAFVGCHSGRGVVNCNVVKSFSILLLLLLN